jgi:hypothetical protein
MVPLPAGAQSSNFVAPTRNRDDSVFTSLLPSGTLTKTFRHFSKSTSYYDEMLRKWLELVEVFTN